MEAVLTMTPTRLPPLRPPGLKSLCVLTLDETRVTDSGLLQYLRSAPPCLSQLSLNQTAVTEATLAVLPSRAPQLRLLSIKKTKVLHLIVSRAHARSSSSSLDPCVAPQVEDTSALARLPCLHTLNLDGTNVTESGLAHLASHPALASLSLAGIPVQDSNRALLIISGG